ncbi:MAG: DUF721 domain-containing protein [bacterium]|nr:DUF721 domain-containing protein [bacterium]
MNSESIENICREIAQKQYTPRGAKPVREAMTQLFARKGYGRIIENSQFEQLWADTVGDRFAKLSRPGVVRRGVLEVTVKSSSVTQELTFQKKSIVKKLAAAGEKIRDLRFRVGET